MTQPQPVIYLPPGVIPASAAPPPGAPPTPGVPFDRAFFERLLPQAVNAFCKQVPCTVPRVEVFTIDGTRHFVNGISGVTDTFVALQTSSDKHHHPMQVFIPYQTIYRVEIHPESDGSRRRLGFVVDAEQPPAIQAPAKERTTVAARAKKKTETAHPS